MILEVKDLKIAFPNALAVDGITFSIEEGKTLALVGESGSGKSATARALMGLADSATVTGEIAFKGERMGMLFQQVMSALNPTLTIGYQITEGLRYHQRCTKKQALNEAKNLLKQVDVNPERLFDYPHQFSGGQRQRIVLAIALSCRPQLLICDEPTTALDVETEAQILTLLKEVQKQQNLAILFITHNLNLISGIAEHTAVMHRGHIVEIGKTEEILTSPKHPYTKTLLAKTSAPSPPPKTSSPLFSLQNVSKTYRGHTALTPFSLTLHREEIVGLIGPSGCGKSTIAKLMMRLLTPTSGKLLYKGQPLESYSRKALAKQVQIIFQDPYSSLDPRMTLEECVGEGMEVLNLHTPSERKKRIRELLFQVGLNPEHTTRYPHQFSGGQRQRIGIARALAVNPQVLICDEPLSSLDWVTQRQILTLLKRLQQQIGFSILFISHDLRVVEEIAHRTVSVGDPRS